MVGVRTRGLILTLCLLLMILLVGGTSGEEFSYGDNWTQVGYDEARSSSSPSVGPLYNVTLWEYPVEGYGMPLVVRLPGSDRHTVFVRAWEGTGGDGRIGLYALDERGDGNGSTHVIWKYSADFKPYKGQMAYADGAVWLVGSQGTTKFLHSINTGTGASKFPAQYLIDFPYGDIDLAAHDGYVTATSGGFMNEQSIRYSFDTSTSSRAGFSTSIMGDDKALDGTPAVGETGMLVGYTEYHWDVGGDYTKAYIYSPEGGLIRQVHLEDQINHNSKPSYRNGYFYTNTHSAVYRIPEAGGAAQKIWSGSPESVVAHNDSVIITTFNGVVKVDAFTGEEQWALKNIGDVRPYPAISSNGIVYLTGDHIWALDVDPEDGVDEGVLDYDIQRLGFTGQMDPAYVDRGYDVIWIKENVRSHYPPALANRKLFVVTDEKVMAFFALAFSFSPEGPERRMITEQGGSAEYTLRLENRGAMADTYDLEYPIMPPGWSMDVVDEDGVEFDLASGMYLAQKQAVNLTLTVHAPPNILVNTTVWSNITARSRTDPGLYEVIELTTRLVVIVGMDVSIDPNPAFVIPGDTANFTITINNTGNVPIDVDLNLAVRDFIYSGDEWGSLGWGLKHVTLSDRVLSIDPHEEKRAYVHVWTPPEALPNERAIFALEAMPGGVFSLREEHILTVAVLPHSEVIVSLPRDDLVVIPGEVRRILVTLENRGNIDDSVDLEAQVLGGLVDWEITLSGEEDGEIEDIRVAPGIKVILDMRVKIPDPLSAGSSVILTVDGLAVIGGNVKGANMTLTADSIHDTVLYVPDELVVAPGDGMDFQVNVVNRGNINETVVVDIIDPLTHEIIFDDGEVSRAVDVGPGVNLTLDCTISVPTGNWSGEYAFQLRMRPSAPEATELVARSKTVVVVVPADLSLEATLIDTGADILPGIVLYRPLTVVNTGNVPRDVSVTCEESECVADPASMHLHPGVVGRFDVFMWVNRTDTSMVSETITVVDSLGEDVPIPYELEVVVPDISLGSPSVPDSATPGSLVVSRVGLTNRGDTAIRDIPLELLVDGVLEDTKRIRAVLPHQTSTVVFVWSSISEGDRMVTFRIEPDHFPGDDVFDNEVVRTVTIQEFSGGLLAGQNAILVGGGGFGLVLVLVLGLVVIRKRKGSGSDDEWPDDDDDDDERDVSSMDTAISDEPEQAPAPTQMYGQTQQGQSQSPPQYAQRYGYGQGGQGRPGYGQQQYGARPGYTGQPGYGRPGYGQSGGTPCPQCRSPISPGKKFCGKCGYHVPQGPKGCPSCGAQVPQGMAFCEECGSKV